LFFEGYFNLRANETAYSLLRRTGLTIGARGTYVYSIEGLAEFDYGVGSGWTYSVNGVFPPIAAANFNLHDGYRVEWLYTHSVTNDTGGGTNDTTEHPAETEPTPSPSPAPIPTPSPTPSADEETPPAPAPTEQAVPSPPEPWENPFADVSRTDWFYAYVRIMYERGLMTGVAKSIFAPNAQLSRAMLIHILWRSAGQPSATAQDFSDVAQGQWYVNSIRWARANGLVQGFCDGTFRPNAHITQDHFAAVLTNFGADARDVSGNRTITRAEAAKLLAAFQ
jgi:hypothetical protein